MDSYTSIIVRGLSLDDKTKLSQLGYQFSEGDIVHRDAVHSNTLRKEIGELCPNARIESHELRGLPGFYTG